MAESSGLQTCLTALRADPQLIWAPVRHHSPMCSWQLGRLFRQHQPDVVLIEGPHDASFLIPFLQDDQTQLPLAIYSYLRESTSPETTPPKTASERVASAEPAPDADEPAATRQLKASRVFIPFAEMSPEWQAIQLAKQAQVPCQFIDLPYAARMPGAAADTERDQLLYDNRKLEEGEYLSALLAESDCDDFDQWWDRHFESAGEASPNEFFSQMHHFCLLMRNLSVDSDPETLQREQFMAQQIRPYLTEGKRVLVVCGGYHCLGIAHFLASDDLSPKPIPEPISVPAPQPLPEHWESGSHLIPYALSRFSKKHGYPAGLTDCGYYQQLWQRLSRQPGPLPEDFTRRYHTDLTTGFMTFLQQKNYPVALPQLTDALVMSQQLANLRGIPAGRSELRESLTATLLKSHQPSDTFFRQWLDDYFDVTAIGHVPPGLPVAPLIQDFRLLTTQLGLPTNFQAGAVKKDLSIYRKPKHRAVSQFLHRLRFLTIPYARLMAGPDVSDPASLHLVRERWQCQWQTETDAALIESSHLGASIVDAARNKLQVAFEQDDPGSIDMVSLLLQAMQMGIQQWLRPIFHRVQQLLEQETNLSALHQSLQILLTCCHGGGIFSTVSTDDLAGLIRHTFIRLCARLPRIDNSYATEASAGWIADLSFMTRQYPTLCPATYFMDAIEACYRLSDSAGLIGACAGVLIRHDQLTDSLEDCLAQAFSRQHSEPEAVGDFLSGLLTTNKSQLLQPDPMLSALNHQLSQLDETSFLTCLPALRRAFTQLTPREVAEFSQICIWETHLNLPAQIPAVSQDTLLAAQQLREQWRTSQIHWGMNK
ncbi:DUF5682 family protein [Photobacterium galatheae]|uniref:4-aminobutyrate aminotransferase n=1 Tax=Photobacterium galatheae TaxID=1654360 RepID=A0A066RSF0_9GAMM|nr:DUF5682 family protein [Photobacterium galatheae]KDM90318.1 hypothetical protein EA58_17635 [Photobacterium galatheae]MCM0150801.1 hypothetical protein [Photobacterium galatheae]